MAPRLLILHYMVVIVKIFSALGNKRASKIFFRVVKNLNSKFIYNILKLNYKKAFIFYIKKVDFWALRKWLF